MKTYIVGFKWEDQTEDYITIKSSEDPTTIAKEFKKKDRTGKLESVYVRLQNGNV